MMCPICFKTSCKNKKLNCYHEFCFDCIHKWYQKSDKCPICRKSFNLLNRHNYNTRYSDFNKNKTKIIKELKKLMQDFFLMDYNDKLNQFNIIFIFIYNHKILLNNQEFKNTVIEKIKYLKEKNESLGFYWDQKIY